MNTRAPAIVAVAAGFVLLFGATAAMGQPASALNIRVATDTGPDFSSVDALLASIIKPGMTDEEKCLAAWRAVYETRFWNPDSRGEFTGGTDPIANLNCFMPTICQQDSEMCVALFSSMGYSGRVYQVFHHTVSEVYYGGAWHYLDATLGNPLRDEKGQIVSIVDYHRYAGGESRMGPRPFVAHIDGFVIGHRMDLSFRPGETFTRYWRPLGTSEDYYVPGFNGKRPADRSTSPTPNPFPEDGKTHLQRTMNLRPRQFETPPADAAYANGLWNWQVPPAKLQDCAEEVHGLVASGTGADAYLRPADASKEGYAIFRVQSPYIITSGTLRARAETPGRDDVANVMISTNGGAKWSPMWTASKPQENLDLGLPKIVNGQFEYLVKVTLAGPEPDKVRLANLRLQTLVQANPLALPALKLGKTLVKVSAGEQLERLTINPDLDKPTYREQIEREENIVTAREMNQPAWVRGLCAKEPDKESVVVFKVSAPRPIRRLTMGGQVLGDNDANRFYYSLDNKKWTELPWTNRQQPKVSPNERRTERTDYETVDSIPEGTTTIWVKFSFLRKSPIGDSSKLSLATGLRIDADYVPQRTGKAAPVAVTYCWDERDGDNRTERTDRHVVSEFPAGYEVNVNGDRQPVMKWLKLQLAEE